MNVIGDVKGKTCIIVDDIIDSGGTIVNAAKALKDRGAKEVYVYITHGVLSGEAVDKIENSVIKNLVITDTIDNHKKTMKAKMVTLMNAAIETSGDVDQNDNLVMSGQKNLLETSELSQNVSSVRKIVEIFEKKSALLQLLEKSHRADGIQIFIGEESGYQALDECSVITAPYEADGEILGMLGVIGPTRMAYERVIPIVDITAKLLSKSIK